MANDSLGKAILELAADGTGLKGDLDSAESRVRTATDLMQGLLASIGIGFSLKSVIDATIEAEHESTLLAAAVKATGMAAGFTSDQLKGQAMALQASTGVGDEAIMKMQRTLLSFRNVHGEVFQKASQLALDFAAATGGDAADAARKFGMALNDPVNGLSRLKQAGVAVTDELKAQVETLIRNGDLIGAQKLLIDTLSKSYGGAAVAARDTLGGALNALKENFGNLFLEQEGAGKQLKIFIELVSKSLPTVANIFSAVFAAVRYQVEGVVSNLFYLGQGLNNLVHGEIKAAIGSFGEIVNPIKLAAGSVAAGVLAYEESAASMSKMIAANTKLATSAPTTAGIVKQSAEEMAAALAAPGIAAQKEFDIFIAKSNAKTAAILMDSATEVDTAKQKYDQLTADSQAYYDAEALKLQADLTAKVIGQTTFDAQMIALAQSKEERLAAIKKAAAKAEEDRQKARYLAQMGMAQGFFGNMTTLLTNTLGENNALTKAASIIAGTLQSYLAYVNTLATASKLFMWPIPQVMASTALAAGLSTVAKMRGLESGGPMAKGETALVGEGGPELFTAPRAGHIIPNGEFGGSNSVQVVNNINVSGLDFSNPTIAERILEGIADAAKRGTEAAIPAANAFSDLSLAFSGRAA